MVKRGKRTKSLIFLQNRGLKCSIWLTVVVSVVSGYFLVAERRGNGIKSLIFFSSYSK